MLRPFLNPTVNATTDDFIKLCAHTQSIAGRGLWDPLRNGYSGLRAGRIVELHLVTCRNSGCHWTPGCSTPTGNAVAPEDRTRPRSITISSERCSRELGKLQPAEYGMRSFGWTTRRGRSSPTHVAPVRGWFGELRSRYVRTAERRWNRVAGDSNERRRARGRGPRHLAAVTTEGPAAPRAGARVRHAIAQHLRRIESGRRRAWRFRTADTPASGSRLVGALAGLGRRCLRRKHRRRTRRLRHCLAFAGSAQSSQPAREGEGEGAQGLPMHRPGPGGHEHHRGHADRGSCRRA